MACHGDTPLHSAIRNFKDDVSPVKIMLEHDDGGVNVRNTEGETPLHLAVQNRRCSKELIDLLLKHRADVNVSNFKNDTPLHSAIRSFDGDISHVKILLEHDDGGINVRNSEGETPLLLAVQNLRFTYQLIALLLKHGADVKATTPRDSNTSLHWLTMTNFVTSMCPVGKILIQHGSDVNARNLEGSIPLHFAAKNEGMFANSLLRFLLKCEGDVNASNLNGDTPLHSYLQNKNKSPIFLREFLQKARDVNVVNSNGETPLHLAVRNKKCDINMVKMFLDYGADVSITDARGEIAYRHAYFHAMDEGNNGERADPMLSQMLLHGNALQHVNSSLHVACLFHNADSAHKMLKLGADVNATDAFDHSPLYYALIDAYKDEDVDKKCSTLRLLLDYGADISQPLNSDVHDASNLLELALLCDLWYERPTSNSNLYLNGYDIFVQHVAKLMKLKEKEVERGIDAHLLSRINRQNLDDFSILGKTGYREWLSRCSDELEALSETEVGDSGVSFFDLLVASAKKTEIYAKNKELVKAFQAKKAMFPMYQGMLDAKLDKALERQKLIESAAVSLSDALEFADPSDEFYVRTLSYCSNQDLIKFLNV